MFIKICGITNLQDALVSIEAGATHLGFNFYRKSPRYLTPEKCAEIISTVVRRPSSVVFVGVFVNESAESIESIFNIAGIHLAQLHGEESPEFVASFNGRAFKAFRGVPADPAAYLPSSVVGRPSSPVFLVDSYSPTLYGGTGHTADWSAAAPLAAQYPLLLAGGLTPENVAAAIQQVNPWGVDVASGVEQAPGVKDHVKVRAFIRNALTTDDRFARQTTALP